MGHITLPNKELWTLHFSNLWNQNNLRQGINILHSTCTFILWRWFVANVKFQLKQNGKSITVYLGIALPHSNLLEQNNLSYRTYWSSMYSTPPAHSCEEASPDYLLHNSADINYQRNQSIFNEGVVTLQMLPWILSEMILGQLAAGCLAPRPPSNQMHMTWLDH